MKFKYAKWPSKPTEAFPQRHSTLRPIIPIVIKYQDRRVRIFALLDTGSDYCLFHESVGKTLGIPVEQGKREQFVGSTGFGTAYFHHVVLEIGGWSHECIAGFTPELDKAGVACVILGHAGFFDRYDVTFNFKKEVIEIKKSV
jgi:hypothetical protein